MILKIVNVHNTIVNFSARMELSRQVCNSVFFGVYSMTSFVFTRVVIGIMGLVKNDIFNAS